MAAFRPKLAAVSALLMSVLVPLPSWGIINIGDDIELEGFVKTMNILKTGARPFNDGELTHQRNTAQLEGKYYFLRDGTAFNRFSTGPLEEATFTFLGRAVYDSVFDLRDSYDVLDGIGKEEYKVREAFIDFVMPPFSLRLGRQQVVWGETDNFRALDVINPLDRTWHGTRESWEDIRIPLWMARGIWDIGKIGAFDETFLEVIVIPDDFKTNKAYTDYPRPWAILGIGLQDQRANSVLLGDSLDDLYDLSVNVIDNTEKDTDIRNVQGGFRFKGIWKDVEFSVNYFHGFSQTPGVKVRSAGLIGDTFETVVETVTPRINVFGLTANYSEEKYTQSVIRLETTVTSGVPVSFAPGAPHSADVDGDQYDTAHQSVVMIGIDRPTWIPALNSLRTFFLSGQIFWRRWLDYSSYYRGTSFYEVKPAKVGGTVVPDRYISVNNDKLDQDEFVLTFAASTSYGAAGLWKPLFVFAYDPRSRGGYNKIQMEYLHSKHLVFRLEQHLYWQAGNEDVGPWGLGSWLAQPGIRRNETVFTATFQF
ncbi:MAG TPA: hypothetical protein DCF62_02625 [Porticoccaceae bacterium]|nr:hypothetical protein [Porticoccaceae bacterium]